MAGQLQPNVEISDGESVGSNSDDDSDFLADDDELVSGASTDGDDDGHGGGEEGAPDEPISEGEDDMNEANAADADGAGTSDYIAIADLLSGPHVVTRMGVKAARAKERMVICPGQDGYTKVIRDSPVKDGVMPHSPTFSYVLAAPASAPAAKERVFVVAKAPGKGRQPAPTMQDIRKHGHFVLLAISATCDMRRFRTLCAEEFIRVSKEDIAAVTAASDPAIPANKLAEFKAKHPEIARAIPFPYLSHVSVTAANTASDRPSPAGAGAAGPTKKKAKPSKAAPTVLSDTTTVTLSSAGFNALVAGSPRPKLKHKPNKLKPVEPAKPKPTEPAKPKPVEPAKPKVAGPVKPKPHKPRSANPSAKPVPTPAPDAGSPPELSFSITVSGPASRLKRLFSTMADSG